ncbi:SDR family NAD(P)-dependent oxidoreductase [Streptomyces sp. NPDC051993]|uniref:SDR family NAD(P)-dependent oxidoreductase n=1 Tax=unclassified Streptomyces TaxID=2593676 RepID=UPI0034381761
MSGVRPPDPRPRPPSAEVDILVTNVGITPRGHIEETAPELFAEAFAVNVRAPFFLTQAGLKRLRDGGRLGNRGRRRRPVARTRDIRLRLRPEPLLGIRPRPLRHVAGSGPARATDAADVLTGVCDRSAVPPPSAHATCFDPLTGSVRIAGAAAGRRQWVRILTGKKAAIKTGEKPPSHVGRQGSRWGAPR